MNKAYYILLLIGGFLVSCQEEPIEPNPTPGPAVPSEYFISYEIDGVPYEYRHNVDGCRMNSTMSYSSYNNDSVVGHYYSYINVQVGNSSTQPFFFGITKVVPENEVVSHIDQAISIKSYLYLTTGPTSAEGGVFMRYYLNGAFYSTQRAGQDLGSYFTITNSEFRNENGYSVLRAVSGEFSCYLKLSTTSTDSVLIENGHFKLPWGI